MDQLRKILRWLKEQHFWVLSVLVALIAMFCWWSASGTLSTEFEANKSEINNQFNSISTLRNKPFHPNDVINQKQIQETQKQAKDVKETWQRLYDRQRENVLEWPGVLGKDFIDYVADIEFGQDIPPHLRDKYKNYVERHFPELPEKVGARMMQPGESGGYGGGEGAFGGRGAGYSRGYGARDGGGEYADPLLQEDDDYICEWLDQNVVREELNFPQRPSSIRIWVTQENLWVYHTLLQAIANTNEAAGATRISNAAVRIIYSLEVGSRAAVSSRGKGRIYMLPSAMPDATMLGGEGEMAGIDAAGERGGYGYAERGAPFGGGEYMGGRGEMGMGGPMTDEQEAAMLVSGRYLDAEGQPLGGGGGMDPMMLGDPMMGADPAAAVAPSLPQFGSTEYKRLPVRMHLQMDQRWLTRLLSECANQPLQVEVQEVRINPQGGLGGDGGGGGYGGGGYGGGRGYEGMGGAGANLFGDRTSGVQTFRAQPHIVDVVIQGVIYIFNEPNPDVLQTPAEEPQVALAGTQ